MCRKTLWNQICWFYCWLIALTKTILWIHNWRISANAQSALFDTVSFFYIFNNNFSKFVIISIHFQEWASSWDDWIFSFNWLELLEVLIKNIWTGTSTRTKNWHIPEDIPIVVIFWFIIENLFCLGASSWCSFSWNS